MCLSLKILIKFFSLFQFKIFIHFYFIFKTFLILSLQLFPHLANNNLIYYNFFLVGCFYDFMNFCQMLFNFPDFLEFLSAQMTCCFAVIITTFFSIMNVLNVSNYIVAVEEFLAANIARIVAFTSVTLREREKSC